MLVSQLSNCYGVDLFRVLLFAGRPNYNDDFYCGDRHLNQHWNRKSHADCAVSSALGHCCSHAFDRLLLWICPLCDLQTQPVVGSLA